MTENQIKARLQASTQGEWRAETHIDFPAESGYGIYLAPADLNPFGSDGDIASAYTAADAEFIAHVHQDVRFLLELVSTLREELSVWQSREDAQAAQVAEIEREYARLREQVSESVAVVKEELVRARATVLTAERMTSYARKADARIAELVSLVASAWDEGVVAGFQGSITRQNSGDVIRTNPYRNS